MIGELFLYLTTRASKEARIFGHLYESIALESREKRCRIYWQPHRENCKNLIKQALRQIKQKNAVLVLGSGPLHEIPVEELSNQFSRVDLVDIVHLRSTKKNYDKYKNLNFIEADLTELEKTIYQEKKISNKVPSLLSEEKYDLVISANILSQLPNHLVSFLQSNIQYSEESLENFRSQICKDHFQYLKNFKTPTLLYTDVETHFYSPDGSLISKEDSFIKFELPAPIKEWEWNLAPIPEASKDYSIKMKVSAFVLNF